MLTGAFKQREQALENEFFRRVDNQLMERLRKSLAEQDCLENLAQATGIRDQEVLHHWLDAGLSSSSLVALTLAPLVIVAWTDGRVDEDERREILAAADAWGVAMGSEAGEVLAAWLDHEPDRELLATWQEYVHCVAATIDDEVRAKLNAEIMARCAAVATASGGLLGIGAVSTSEHQALDAVKAALAS